MTDEKRRVVIHPSSSSIAFSVRDRQTTTLIFDQKKQNLRMASSTSAAASTTNPSSSSTAETAIQEYMRHFVDYQENGIDFTELSEIRQLDLYLQSKIVFVFENKNETISFRLLHSCPRTS